MKDRFWRTKRVFLNVDDLTVNGLGFAATRPLKKRKFDLTNCLRELLTANVIELGRGQTDVADLFLRRGKGVYVVQLFEGAYFRRPESERTTTQRQVIADDPLFEPLRAIGVDAPAIRRLLKTHARKGIQQWLRITDAAVHETPRGFPGFTASPAAFLIDGIQKKRMPPDWFHAHEKDRERRQWDETRAQSAAHENTLREQYHRERHVALHAYLATPEGRELFARYDAIFTVFYQKVEPDRFEAAARDATTGKIDREELNFPDFGVWVLDQWHATQS